MENRIGRFSTWLGVQGRRYSFLAFTDAVTNAGESLKPRKLRDAPVYLAVELDETLMASEESRDEHIRFCFRFDILADRFPEVIHEKSCQSLGES
jgi:hypothetical protein